PRAHAGRIARYRKIEILADFGEFLHVSDLLLHVGPAHSLDATDELDVVATSEVLLHTSREADGPGKPRHRNDLARIRHIHRANQAHQRRFAGSVAPDEADVLTLWNVERKIPEHDLTPAQRQV